jgi:peptidoglycan/LPS O-acetylase OafA/YrhL
LKPSRAPALHGVELLRFVCAFAVLMWHYQHFSFVAYQAHDFDPARQPFHALLGFFYRYGLYGVRVFWCISGCIFFWQYGAAIAARGVTAGRFFVLRFSRLYPLHLATLLLVALLQALYFGVHQYYFVYRDNGAASFLLQLPMASNWFDGERPASFNGPIWSVSLELLAYLFFFAWTRLAGAGAAATAAVALAAGLAWRLAGWPVLECLLYFYLGGLVALGHGALRLARWRPALLAALAALLVLVLAAAWHGALGVTAVLLLATPAALALLLALPVRGAALARGFDALGNLTYASYLLHFPLQVGIALACGALGMAVPWASPWLWLGFVGATLGLAHLCHRWFEMPAQRWLRARQS